MEKVGLIGEAELPALDGQMAGPDHGDESSWMTETNQS